jgi:hypothetical protein
MRDAVEMEIEKKQLSNKIMIKQLPLLLLLLLSLNSEFIHFLLKYNIINIRRFGKFLSLVTKLTVTMKTDV